MNINELCKEAHQNAIKKGWHEEERSFGELIALVHSELSEALEEYRAGNPIAQTYTSVQSTGYKPEGVPAELADVIIRIFDMCGKYGIDLEEAIKIKMEYNKVRSYRHGGKKI